MIPPRSDRSGVGYNTGMPPSVPRTSDFATTIYALTRQIPQGKVATYGQLAKMAGRPQASRAVGMCMKHNPDAPRTPCHRVVAADGQLTGYSGGQGLSTKKAMLLAEGVTFQGEKVDLSQSLWQPKPSPSYV